MALNPKIPKQDKSFLLKKCSRCGNSFGPENYSKTKSYFYPDGYLPICNDCLKEYLIKEKFNWDAVDKICQYADIPFIPREFERIHEMNGDNCFPLYAEVFLASEFDGLHWGDYFKEFVALKGLDKIEEELPLVGDEYWRKLYEKWGNDYDETAINYMENLLEGMKLTQNINSKLQQDQALKLCRLSWEIDQRTRAGVDFDKLLSSYEKLVKVADFTPKNIKNANNFETIGELIKWLEKGGWRNKFYDGVSRDIVDETIKNIQNWNRNLYINESGIGDEISKRIESLKIAEKAENYYDLVDGDYDPDEVDNEAYRGLIYGENEFAADVGDGANV